jgi:hypothetical protein
MWGWSVALPTAAHDVDALQEIDLWHNPACAKYFLMQRPLAFAS